MPFGNENGVTAPWRAHVEITPSNTTLADARIRTIYCAEGGDVAVQDSFDTVLVYAMAAGDILPCRPKRIMATGTTATVIGWW